MEYILVENRTTVLLGPMPWRHRFFQSELNDLEIEYTISPTEPNAHLSINDNIEIFPVEKINVPEHNTLHQQLAGPFWTYDNNVAIGTYHVAEKEEHIIKNELKALTASERYTREVSGTKITIQDIEISLPTDRESRNVFFQKLISMNENDTIQWKFNEGWLTLNKSEMNAVVDVITNHVQSHYDWEKDKIDEIENATTEQLKNIVIINNS